MTDTDNRQAGESADRFEPDATHIEASLAKRCDADRKAYALIDGEYCPGLYGRLINFQLPWATLLQGKAAEANIQNAVFVVELQFGHKFTQWLIEENWGRGCIVWLVASTKALTARYARTHMRQQEADPTTRPTRLPYTPLVEVPAADNEPIQLLRRHFRRFTELEMEDSSRLLDFRFQDPATLRTYLLSCNEAELARFLEPITDLWVENYSHVPSLNKPHQLYEFRHRVETVKDAHGYEHHNVSRLDAALYDFTRQQVIDFERPPMQTERPGRQTTSGLIMLRHGQIRAFEEEELVVMKEEIVSSIAALGIWPWKDPQQLHRYIRKKVEIALGLNINLWSEVWSFAVCVLGYGDAFYKSIPSLNTAIEARAQSGESDDDLKTHLVRMANFVIEGQKHA